MPEQVVNGVRVYYEEHGEGDPILCIHGGGSSAVMWEEAVEELARLGRVIVYDRRGCTRSERPEPYERTSVAERVRALVLLEGDALGVSPAALKWTKGIRDRLREVAAQDGVDAVYEALIGEVIGEGAWASFPDEARRILTHNGSALLAELGYVDEPMPDAAAFATIDKPVLLVEASESPPEQSDMTEAMAAVLPNARTSLIGGGHLIDPAAPDVLTSSGRCLGDPRQIPLPLRALAWSDG
jgi:esterase